MEYYVPRMMDMVFEPDRLFYRTEVNLVHFRLASEDHPYGDVSEGLVVLRGQCVYLPRRIACNDFDAAEHTQPKIRITLDTMIG